MPRLESHITRILGESRECLTAAEITDRLNHEVGRNDAYRVGEILGVLQKMPNVYAKGEKYCRKPEDASQAAARIVKEATEDS